jgi:hypothetical protein
MKKNLSKVLGASLVLGMLCVPACAFAEEDTITVTVSAYDYNAVDGGLSAASADGVILDQYQVELPAGSTDVDAVKKAFEDNGISLTVSDSYYGGSYVSEIGGLSEYANPTAEPDYSGWMLEYNGDHFTNYGLGSLGANGDGVLSDGDVLSFDYSLDGGVDLGSVYSGIPVLNSLTVGGQTKALAKVISYDENWNSIYSFTVDGEEATGSGTEDDPFVLTYDLGTVDSSAAEVSFSASHYFAVDGVEDSHDFAETLKFTVSTASGLVSYYEVQADYEVEQEETEDNTTEDPAGDTDAEPVGDQANNTGDMIAFYGLLSIVVLAAGVLAVSRKYDEA